MGEEDSKKKQAYQEIAKVLGRPINDKDDVNSLMEELEKCGWYKNEETMKYIEGGIDYYKKLKREYKNEEIVVVTNEEGNIVEDLSIEKLIDRFGINDDNKSREIKNNWNEGNFQTEVSKEKQKIFLDFGKIIRKKIWNLAPPAIALMLSLTILAFIPFLWVSCIFWLFVALLPSEDDIMELARKMADIEEICPKLLLLEALYRAKGDEETANKIRKQYESYFK